MNRGQTYPLVQFTPQGLLCPLQVGCFHSTQKGRDFASPTTGGSVYWAGETQTRFQIHSLENLCHLFSPFHNMQNVDMEKYPDSPVGFLAYLAIGIAHVSASLISYPGETPSMTATSPAVPVFLRLGAGEVRPQQFLSSSLRGMAFAGLEPFLLDPEWSQSGSRGTCYVG